MVNRELWADLIDYAGVFPPASHPLDTALEEYRTSREGPGGWIMGPCLLRASQISDVSLLPHRLGAVLDVDPSVVADSGLALVQIEIKTRASNADETIRRANELSPVVYVETVDAPADTHLATMADWRARGRDVRAKIRTGGASADAFPSVTEVAGFIRACVDLGVPFKATAGLHQPFRHPSAVDGATEHGFINLLAGARAAVAGETDKLEAILDDPEPAHFDVTRATWKGVGTEIPDAAVRAVFRSFGSCSFSEPVAYLVELGAIGGTLEGTTR